ncbi:MAG: 4-hydroxythreonine-4-phosphate dehydrogenase PdxA, partial [Nitrospirota bacterium]|nr:4-hydroxythreonine-4-phosphate dehydrogenase PdxA [Nitrospirota bacterium]
MPRMTTKPLIAITAGDPGGIGPEIIIKALSEPRVYRYCRPLVIGDAAVFRYWLRRLRRLSSGLALQVVDEGDDQILPRKAGVIPVLDIDSMDEEAMEPGRPTAVGGKASVLYIQKAAQLALSGMVEGVCTAPISKEAINLAGFPYQGHTELLGKLCDTDDFGMMLAGKKIRVMLVTTHEAMVDVPKLITREKVLRAIRLAHRGCRELGIEEPRIGLCALNPHGGESGLFGREEIDIIGPAAKMARDEGIDVTPPLPADTLFVKVRQGMFDVAVVMYHDQGLIPLKMLSFGRAV